MKSTGYMSVKEAAEKWMISARRVQSYCVSGRLTGAEKWGYAWMIPANAGKPVDGRIRSAIQPVADVSFIRESPLLVMTDLYVRPGSADEVLASLKNLPATKALFGAYIHYLRGEIDAACEEARRCLDRQSGFYAQISAGMLVSLCAMYRGDEALWNAARERICLTKCESLAWEEARAFWLAAADSAIYGDSGYPEWFCRGAFDALPADSQPAARFFYAKHLFLQAVNALRDKDICSDEENLYYIRFLPRICEPLIAQTKLEGILLAEVYLRLICAIGYHMIGDDARAKTHIDRAITLALPDRLYAPLAEYTLNLDFLLDERLRAADEHAYLAVRKLNRQMNNGWVSLHNRVFTHTVSANLTIRERETARLAVMGMNNREISERLCVSVSTVKQSLRSAMGKTNAQTRTELARFL